MVKDNLYDAHIGRSHNPVNDQIFDYLKERIDPPFLDVGTNLGILLSEVSGGIGIDASLEMIKLAREAGCEVYHADACELPFEDNTFQTVVISCVLEQIEDWRKALDEALRVCKTGGHIIGINPIPGTEWGIVGGNSKWVKSVIAPEDLTHYKADITYLESIDKYFFDITKKVL